MLMEPLRSGNVSWAAWFLGMFGIRHGLDIVRQLRTPSYGNYYTAFRQLTAGDYQTVLPPIQTSGAPVALLTSQRMFLIVFGTVPLLGAAGGGARSCSVGFPQDSKEVISSAQPMSSLQHRFQCIGRPHLVYGIPCGLFDVGLFGRTGTTTCLKVNPPTRTG